MVWILFHDLTGYFNNWFIDVHDTRSVGNIEEIPRIGWNFGTCNTAGMFNVSKLVRHNVSYELFHFISIAATGRYAYGGCASLERSYYSYISQWNFPLYKFHEDIFPFQTPPTSEALGNLNEEFKSLAAELGESGPLNAWKIYVSLLLDKCQLIVACRLQERWLENCCEYFYYEFTHASGELNLLMNGTFLQHKTSNRENGLEIIIDKDTIDTIIDETTVGSPSDHRMPYTGPDYFKLWPEVYKEFGRRMYRYGPYLSIQTVSEDRIGSRVARVKVIYPLQGQEMSVQLQLRTKALLSNCVKESMCPNKPFQVQLAYSALYNELCGCTMCNPSFLWAMKLQKKINKCCSPYEMVSCLLRPGNYDSNVVNMTKSCQGKRKHNLLTQQRFQESSVPINRTVSCLENFLPNREDRLAGNFRKRASCILQEPCFKREFGGITTFRKRSNPAYDGLEKYFSMKFFIAGEVNEYSQVVRFKMWEFAGITLGVIGMLTGFSLYSLGTIVIDFITACGGVIRKRTSVKHEVLTWIGLNSETGSEPIRKEEAQFKKIQSLKKNKVAKKPEKLQIDLLEDTKISENSTRSFSEYNKTEIAEVKTNSPKPDLFKKYLKLLVGAFGIYYFCAVARESFDNPTLKKNNYWKGKSMLPALALCVHRSEYPTFHDFLLNVTGKNSKYEQVTTEVLFNILSVMDDNICRITSGWTKGEIKSDPIDYILTWDQEKVKRLENISVDVYLGDFAFLSSRNVRYLGKSWNPSVGLNIEYTVTKKVQEPSVFLESCEDREAAMVDCVECPAIWKKDPSLILASLRSKPQNRTCCYKSGQKVLRKGKKLCVEYSFFPAFMDGNTGDQSAESTWRGKFAVRKEHSIIKTIETSSRQNLFILILLLTSVIGATFGQNWLDLSITFMYMGRVWKKRNLKPKPSESSDS